MRTTFLSWFALVARALGFLSALPAHTHYFDSGGVIDHTTLQGVTFNGATVTVGITFTTPKSGTLVLALPLLTGFALIQRRALR